MKVEVLEKYEKRQPLLIKITFALALITAYMYIGEIGTFKIDRLSIRGIFLAITLGLTAAIFYSKRELKKAQEKIK